MLVKFTIENYLSFKGRTTIDMSAEALKEKKEYVFVPYLHNAKLCLLKSAVILGFNAFGKTNLIRGYAFYRHFILNSFTLNKTIREIDVQPFLFNTSTIKKPSYFEATFILKNTKYRYGFELTRDKIISEWLYYADGPIRENSLFIRGEQEIREIGKQWNKDSDNKVEQTKSFTKPHNLFLSVLIEQDNIPRITEIGEWLKGNIILKNQYEISLEEASNYYSDSKYTNAILKFLESPDLGITNIHQKLSGTVSNSNIHKELINYLNETKVKNFELFTTHQTFDENYNPKGVLELNLIKNESSGTIKYFVIACYLAYAIVNSQLIWIDELDASLHSQLLSFIIRIFNNNKNNMTGSQLIFSTHNTILLDNKLRRDQIYIVDKNEYGESRLIKAHTSKTPIRINKSIEREYREGTLNIGVSKKLAKNELPSLFPKSKE